MWYLQHGRSKGWEDSADAKNRKRPSFTAGFCYPKNSAGTADPPKQDIGCLLGDFGIIFLLHSASSSARAWKRGLYFAVTIRASCEGQGQWMYSLPPVSVTIPLYPLAPHKGISVGESLGLRAAAGRRDLLATIIAWRPASLMSREKLSCHLGVQVF